MGITVSEGKIEIRGARTGVNLLSRGANNQQVVVELWIEDDGLWRRMVGVSSQCLEDLTAVLVEAKVYLDANCEPSDFGAEYGYQFKAKAAPVVQTAGVSAK